MMEKYAVDKSDDVEVRAEELVKTGEAKNINEARERVSLANNKENKDGLFRKDS